MPIELGLQLLAGFVLLSDVGFLTPVSVMDVPHVKLPMRIWETSEMAAAKVCEQQMTCLRWCDLPSQAGA